MKQGTGQILMFILDEWNLNLFNRNFSSLSLSLFVFFFFTHHFMLIAFQSRKFTRGVPHTLNYTQPEVATWSWGIRQQPKEVWITQYFKWNKSVSRLFFNNLLAHIRYSLFYTSQEPFLIILSFLVLRNYLILVLLG